MSHYPADVEAPPGATVSLPERPLESWIAVVFVASGAVSLAYQVLWMRGLGLLFGNTAQAAATTITAFFLGLALGGWIGGILSARIRHPLRAYGWVEIGIGVAAVLFHGLLAAYGTMYPALFRMWGEQPAVLLAFKLVLGVLVLLPASTLIGATLPLVGQHLLRDGRTLGRGGTLLYALNTFGAALGAWLAGAVLPVVLGFSTTYALAVGINVGLGVLVLAMARPSPAGALPAEPPPAPSSPHPGAASRRRVILLAALTGLTTLALEVLWTHMFTQVLHNSVYTFAIILVVFLVALAAGSMVARSLAASANEPLRVMTWLLGLGGALVVASPWTFYALTGGMKYVADQQGWLGYQAVVLTLVVVLLAPPTVLLGAAFPFLIKLSESHGRGPGRTLGDLIAVNTLAGIAGSLLAGFVLLGTLGLWGAIRAMGVLALLGALWLVPRRSAVARMAAVAGSAALLLWTIRGGGHPPKLRLDAAREERLVELREGASGVVAVVRTRSGLVIKMNNHYTLGGSGSQDDERRQGLLPLLIHPDPREVFYLGMGTGITASGAMIPGVERITVCELVPEIIQAARAHFGEFTGGLFTDPRTRILAEDGRTFLRVTPERYDVIISDLFVPWEARAGNLYSFEHYRAARERLRPGGLFAQWLPGYQLSRREVAIIARTMLDVFPRVTVWRGDWKSDTPAFALIGHTDDQPLDPDGLARRLAGIPEPGLLGVAGSAAGRLLWSYCGDLARARQLVARAPRNSDARPWIEYLTPVTHRQVGTGTVRWMTGANLDAWVDELLTAAPPADDPYLARVDPAERGFALAGRLTYRGAFLRHAGDAAGAAANDGHLRDVLIDVISRRSGSARPRRGPRRGRISTPSAASRRRSRVRLACHGARTTGRAALRDPGW